MDMKLESIVLPVADVDRTRAYFETLGWQVDLDHQADGFPIVQVTPPGSPCSVVFGTGLAAAPAGSIRGLLLSVADLEAARAELTARGVDVSEIFHDASGTASYAETYARAPGLDPERRSHASFATFSDPDGNVWQLREISTFG
ncbi:glyoxalase [Agromyces intestinalis]|uniref:Glyoxalase n=1 Tax=Agromyces intestinalis TaxID=2592652 RepID=A0A5C1YD07_9MICO|nr:VOC family protein [Agromyces intestinalis]QEO13069.1 glyoxalase [Agromyces intestinalis]